MVFNLVNKLAFDKKYTIELPSIGDIVIIKYFYCFTGKLTYFSPQVVVGRCIAIRKKKGICCSIILRNVIQKTGFEFCFFLNSPLIYSIKIVPQNFLFTFRSSKLFFFRKKKLSKSIVKFF